jgi:hypothetical protein
MANLSTFGRGGARKLIWWRKFLGWSVILKIFGTLFVIFFGRNKEMEIYF